MGQVSVELEVIWNFTSRVNSGPDNDAHLDDSRDGGQASVTALRTRGNRVQSSSILMGDKSLIWL